MTESRKGKFFKNIWRLTFSFHNHNTLIKNEVDKF